ncbi:MAG: response regulator [Bryobacteraceae bacterium]|nr:response regulator [Bryobacteraceae bacterium]
MKMYFPPHAGIRSVVLLVLLVAMPASASRVFRMGYEHSPPVQLVDSDGQIRGPVHEVLSEAAARRGIQLEWVHAPEGPDRALASGKVDLWPLMADIPERRGIVTITGPYLRTRWWLVSREESGIRSVEDLRGRQVLRMPGLLAKSLVRRYLPHARAEEAANIVEALSRVCRGEAESALVAQGTGDHILLSDQGCDVGMMQVVALPGVRLDYGIGARRGNRPAERAAADLKDSLVELFDDGQMAAIWLRWGLIVTETRMLADYLSTQRYNRMLLALAALLLLAFAIAVWQTLRWRRAQVAAQAAAEAKQTFLANMSHEIRTPMNGVLGLASLLEHSGLNDEQLEYARTIRQSSSALLRLLNDILDAAKMESGQFRLVEAPFNLHDIAAQVAHLSEPQARQKGLGWRLEWEPGLPTHWTGDGARIRQIILNLVGNALKFTKQGSVTLRFGRSGEHLCITVNDTGPGISDELRRHLFQKFVQGEHSFATGLQGTGLGLAITRSLAERMGGSIAFESEPGKGATFAVRLPLRPASAEGVAPLPDPDHFSLPVKPRRVLVVEDNRVNQYVAQRMLIRLGCQVEIAPDAKEALALLDHNLYDVVFMDCGLPGMDGYQLTETIRKRENGTRRTPVVAMTAAALDGDREKCLAAGMDDYLTKPLDLQALNQALTRWTYSASASLTRSDGC